MEAVRDIRDDGDARFARRCGCVATDSLSAFLTPIRLSPGLFTAVELHACNSIHRVIHPWGYPRKTGGQPVDNFFLPLLPARGHTESDYQETESDRKVPLSERCNGPASFGDVGNYYPRHTDSHQREHGCHVPLRALARLFLSRHRGNVTGFLPFPRLGHYLLLDWYVNARGGKSRASVWPRGPKDWHRA